MNILSIAKRAQVLQCLVEGMSIHATSRLTGVARNTVTSLLSRVGAMCNFYQDQVMDNLPCKRIQLDEIWTFCSMKEKRVPPDKKGELGYGDVYVWTAICPDTKLVPAFWLGRRDSENAIYFVKVVASRLQNRVQLSSDGFQPYVEAVEGAFASDIDYAMLVKHYGGERHGPNGTKKCRPSECSGITKSVISGKPDPKHISTSLVERQNLTMRMSMRRFTRKSNGFSRKLWNLECAVALHFMYYNFARIHRTLRVTPAMEAGIEKRAWNLEDIAALDYKEMH